MQPLLDDLREQYLRHPLLSNVDSFKNSQTNSYKVEAEYLTSDPLDDTYIKTISSLTVDPEKGTVSSDSTTATLHDSVMIQKYSRSGKIKATVKMGHDGAMIEIFKNGILWYRKPVPATTHLTPVKSWVFMTEQMHFSEDESRFMYMADDPIPAINIYKLKDAGVARFRYRDSIGDKLSLHTNPTIFIFDLNKKELCRVNKPLESSKQRIVYLHPQFADAQGHSIICTAINMVGVSDQTFFLNHPKKLTYIKGLSIDSLVKGPLGNKLWTATPTPITRPELQEEVAFFPKMSPDFTQVSYFSNAKCHGPSLNSCGLRLMKMDGFATTTIIDEIEEDGPEFTGIQGFHLTLGKYDWLNHDTIVFNSVYHQYYKTYEVQISSQKVSRVCKEVKFLPSESDLFLTKLDSNIFLGKRDCFLKNGILFVARRNEDGSYTEIYSQSIDDYKEFETFDETIEVNGIEAAFYGRKLEGASDKKRAVVVLIHGGPHGLFHNCHTPLLWYQMKHNHAVLNINYTGSAGRGNKFAKNLCGKAGEIEIQEVKAFIDSLIKAERIDPAQIKLSGGSYGGFISLTILKKFPELVKSASIFNPVTNGFSMWLGSSVHSWLDAEFLGDTEKEYRFSNNLSDEQALIVKQKSPMFGEYNFKAQLLIFLGLKDDVVPPLSTRHLFKKLRTNKLKVQLYEYPEEEHLILAVGPHFDYTVKTCLLFAGKHPFN